MKSKHYGIISDLHITEDINSFYYLNQAFNYFIKKGIKDIIFLGDGIDGISRSKSIIEKQIENFERYYPKINDTKTIFLPGNHDLYAFFKHGIDITKINRDDITFLKPTFDTIKINSEKIGLHHPNKAYYHQFYDELLYLQNKSIYKLILRGHGHHYKTYLNRFGTRIICLPSLTNNHKKNEIGFIDLEIENNNGMITNIEHKIHFLRKKNR